MAVEWSIVLWLADKFPAVKKWLKDTAQKDKKRISELEKVHSEEMAKINAEHLDEIANFKKTISALEAKTCNLERQTKIMDTIPKGCWLIEGKVLYDKENGTYYCWNCWNKIVGRERRVLDGNEYYVKCNVCGVGAKLKEYPTPKAAPEEPLY